VTSGSPLLSRSTARSEVTNEDSDLKYMAGRSRYPNKDTRNAITFCYYAAWRGGEVKELEFSKIDLNDLVIRLPRKNSKISGHVPSYL
jgi:hypothetical protein